MENYCYIRKVGNRILTIRVVFAIMKERVSIVGLFIFLLLWGTYKVSASNDMNDAVGFRLEETVADMSQQLEELGNELKNCTCLLPQCMVRLAHSSVHTREQEIEKVFLQNRLKGENQLYKISELNSGYQTLKVSALFCREGHYVYALRKLLI